MTRDELQQLSDEKLIELVATEVMGWYSSKGNKGLVWWRENGNRMELKSMPYPMVDDDEIPLAEWNPLTSISDCWMVVDKMKASGFEFALTFAKDYWLATFRGSFSDSLSPEYAILHAALLAHES